MATARSAWATETSTLAFASVACLESSSASAFAMVAVAASREAVLDFHWLVDSRRIWGSTTPRLTSCVSRLTSVSQRSTSA